MRRRRILFTGFGVRMGDTRRLPKCVMFGELVGGAGCVFFLDNFKAFGINADQWTTAAHDEGECRKKAEQGAELFMTKWIA